MQQVIFQQKESNMTNINKYFIILESLRFPTVGVPEDEGINRQDRIKFNLKELQSSIKLTSEDITISLIKEHNLMSKPQDVVNNADNNNLYCLYSLKMLWEISKNVNFASDAREDLISERHKSLIISSLIDVASIALQENLHGVFYKEKRSIFKKVSRSETNYCWLKFVVEVISPLIHIKSLHVGKCLEDVQLWYTAAIFSVLIAADCKEYQVEPKEITNLQTKLQKLWLELSKKLHYRNLMLLYSVLPNAQKKIVYREMLMRLRSEGGFMALLFAITESQSCEEQSMDEMIANLVARPNYSIKAQQSLIDQILEFLQVSLKNKDLLPFMGAGILSLKKLYDNKEENRNYLVHWLEKQMYPLIKVEDNNLIAMEWQDFVYLISLLFHLFCTSAIATLPSDLLKPYLPLLIEVYNEIGCRANQEVLRNFLRSLIVKILHNRTKNELEYIIQYLALKRNSKEWFRLHARIYIKENPLNIHELKLCFVENEAIVMENKDVLESLTDVVLHSSHNLLIYQYFIILLQLVPSLITELSTTIPNTTNIELMEDEDIYNKIILEFSQMYESKFRVIKSLESLIQHQPLKTLISENIKELLKVLQDILSVFITLGKDNTQMDTDSTVLMILLILIREIVESCTLNIYDLQSMLLKPLKQLHTKVESKNVKYQLSILLKLLDGKETFQIGQCNSTKSMFEEARSLIESNESYMQVEGIEKIIKLLYKRDEYTIANSHILIALALNTLKSPESYTFLNCIRLFVALVNVNESEVLELLSDEYVNEALAIDYRLVIGETILKVSRELGPLSYKYRSVLLNTYMIGCRSTLDEFRLSAFSNLAQMCRILTYQVHSYFQELLQLINCELTTGKYLPAKRAAVLVLSELLAGIDNLFDYQEMLLPIYRLLKCLVSSETSDEKIRIHASNGLKCLSNKCEELIRDAISQGQQGPLEKEIKIMGIRDKSKRNLKDYILEIN